MVAMQFKDGIALETEAEVITIQLRTSWRYYGWFF